MQEQKSPMSAWGHFRQIPAYSVMSALPPIATKIATLIDVRFVPIATRRHLFGWPRLNRGQRLKSDHSPSALSRWHPVSVVWK